MAAGGIVMRREQPPLIAVVRLRKRDEWVLPKGKLNEGETTRAAARREVLEETGHNITVHEFLGTLVYESGGRSKIVHYWRMEAAGAQARELMDDIRAVDWLPLEAAVERLSRAYERAFLENVAPSAVRALNRRLKAKAHVPAIKAAAAKKRRVKPAAIPPEVPHFAGPAVEEMPAQPELQGLESVVIAEAAVEVAVPEPPATLGEEELIPQPDGAESKAQEVLASAAPEDDGEPSGPNGRERKSLAQKVRSWLGRAA